MALARIALIGYGEVGRILAEDLRAPGRAVTAYDLKLRTAEAEPLRAHAHAHQVTLAEAHAGAVRNAELVISAVTAAETVAAAEACAPALSPKSFFLDLNSASPGMKTRAAELVAARGGCFVEGAVMTSVPPHRLKVPMLLGGPHAAKLAPLLDELGFAARIASAKLGVASATKMCRSVVIKGLEALLIESLVAARQHGVEDAVLISLRETFPQVDWEKQAAYFFQRAIQHGRRRSDEMREAAVAVRETGLTPWSAVASAERHGWVADLGDRGVFGERKSPTFARSPDWRVEADRILDALAAEKAD